MTRTDQVGNMSEAITNVSDQAEPERSEEGLNEYHNRYSGNRANLTRIKRDAMNIQSELHTENHKTPA